MAVAVARHLLKVDPGNPGAWINLAYSVRCAESIEQAEAIVLTALIIAFNLACVSVTGHMEEAKVRLPSILIKDIRRLAVDGDDPTDQEASECSNTVKYHDVCRSLQKWDTLSKSQHGIVARREGVPLAVTAGAVSVG